MSTRRLMAELKDALARRGAGAGAPPRSMLVGRPGGAAAAAGTSGGGAGAALGVAGARQRAGLGGGGGRPGGAFTPRLPAVPEPADRSFLESLKGRTIAKVGIGRAGTRLRTETAIQFLADRAIAVEAVRSRLPEGFAESLGLLRLHTLARDLDEFLLRPDLGRRLPDEALERVRRECRRGPDVQVIVGDGLSASAVAENAPPMLRALLPALEARRLTAGTPILVERSRVKVEDVIGQAVGAKVAVILLGERPGLGTGDGMSAYLIYDPKDASMDSDRNVISNIHARGIPPAAAAERAAAMCELMLRQGTGGVRLDVSGLAALEPPRVRANAMAAPGAAGVCPQSHGQVCGRNGAERVCRQDAPPCLALSMPASARCAG